MKVSGFTFVRNAVRYDYPVVESIQSMLPLCDEVIVSVGNSDDETLSLIQSIASPKIKMIQTVWDDTLRKGGKVLAAETDKALKAVSAGADWCLYLQADEVLHEKDYNNISRAMQQWKDDKQVDGLLFNYRHFHGSYSWVSDTMKTYRKEIRIVRQGSNIFSWGDAQGFRKNRNEKLIVKQIDAQVFHYGWVRNPDAMQRKQQTFHRLWHNDEWVEKNVTKVAAFNYADVDVLRKFTGTHPALMKNRIENCNWVFDWDENRNHELLRYKLKRAIEKITGYRFGEYKNYRMV